jgi:hypothetical protein
VICIMPEARHPVAFSCPRTSSPIHRGSGPPAEIVQRL